MDKYLVLGLKPNFLGCPLSVLDTFLSHILTQLFKTKLKGPYHWPYPYIQIRKYTINHIFTVQKLSCVCFIGKCNFKLRWSFPLKGCTKYKGILFIKATRLTTNFPFVLKNSVGEEKGFDFWLCLRSYAVIIQSRSIVAHMSPLLIGSREKGGGPFCIKEFSGNGEQGGGQGGDYLSYIKKTATT